MFRQAKNIDTAFRQTRLVALIAIIGAAMVTLYGQYTANKTLQKSASRIFILEGGNVRSAFAADRKDNIPVEARHHIGMFHYYFFSLDPDEKVIQKNITKALYLADASAKSQYDNLKENSYYANIIAGNISQELTEDSIQFDAAQYPYYFRFYGKQKIVRPTSIVTRSLVTEGFLRNVTRSDNNPHGLLIEKWKTVENKDINVTAR